MKKMIYMLLASILCAVILIGCDSTTTPKDTETSTLGMEEMERVDVYLPDFEDEYEADWKAFYEKYKDVVIVVTGVVGNVRYNRTMKEIPVSQSGDGRHGNVYFGFDDADRTEQVMGLNFDEHVVMEGILVQPRTPNSPKPSKIVLEHAKLLEWSEAINRLALNFDIEPAFEETKAALLDKYPFIVNVEFSIRYSSNGVSEDISFITDVKTGTDPQAVLEYADYAARLLNDNAMKYNDKITPSSGDSYGSLYRVNYLVIGVRPEGVVEAANKYYIQDVVTARVGKVIKLNKMYR